MEMQRFRKVVNTIEFRAQALSNIDNKNNNKTESNGLTSYFWENTNKLLG